MKKLIMCFAAIAAAVALAFTVHDYPLADAGALPPRVGSGKVAAVQVFAPEDGTAKLSAVWSADVYTNAYTYAYATSHVWTVAYSNTVNAAIYTNTYGQAGWPMPIYSVPLATNHVESVTVTTNTATAWKETVSTNVTIVSGNPSNHFYQGAPASATYISLAEKLVFEGTATNGWLRIILE